LKNSNNTLESLSIVGEVELINNRGQINVQGDYLHVVFRDRGRQIIDISEANRPEILVTDYDANIHADVVFEADYCFSMRDGDLTIEDFSGLDVPSTVSRFNTSEYGTVLDVLGHYAYCSGFRSTLQIVDVSDLTAPVQVGWVPLGQDIQGICASPFGLFITLYGGDVIVMPLHCDID
jgi:hypothetical protein